MKKSRIENVICEADAREQVNTYIFIALTQKIGKLCGKSLPQKAYKIILKKVKITVSLG